MIAELLNVKSCSFQQSGEIYSKCFQHHPSFTLIHPCYHIHILFPAFHLTLFVIKCHLDSDDFLMRYFLLEKLNRIRMDGVSSTSPVKTKSSISVSTDFKEVKKWLRLHWQENHGVQSGIKTKIPVNERLLNGTPKLDDGTLDAVDIKVLLIMIR